MRPPYAMVKLLPFRTVSIVGVKTMTITLELKPEMEERAVELAEACGVSVEDFIESVIEENLNGRAGGLFAETASLEEWTREFQAWVDSHDYITAPPADDSRESIYRDGKGGQL